MCILSLLFRPPDRLQPYGISRPRHPASPKTPGILRINGLLKYYINIALPIFEHRKNIYIYYTDCMQDKRLSPANDTDR